MPKTIAPLPRGHYWATPHAPFPLDDPEVFPGAHCVSDGKWVAFYNGEEVWRFEMPSFSAARQTIRTLRQQPG